MKSKFNSQLIVEKREDLDLTIRNISNELGIDPSKYKDIERGIYKGNVDIIKNVCTFLKLDISDVYDDNFKETDVICFFINKGGVGKTTSAVATADLLAQKGNKVLCIDTDAQGNLTGNFNMLSNSSCNLMRMIEDENVCENIVNYIVSTDYENIDIIPFDTSLQGLVPALTVRSNGELFLKEIVQALKEKGIYDYIIIDSTPTHSKVNDAIILASNYVISPIELDAFSLEGIGSMVSKVNSLKRYNDDFKANLFLLTKFRKTEKSLINIYLEAVKDKLGESLFNTIIHTDVKVKNAQAARKTLSRFEKENLRNKSTKAGEDYRVFVEELLVRISG